MKYLIWLSILPSIIIGYLIYKEDKVEKEPYKELIKAFVLGIISVVITLVLSLIIDIDNVNIYSNGYISIAFYSFICISLIEEFSKWICTYLFLKNNKNFDYMFDGIIYAVFVSLGFATIENILYTVSGGIGTAIMRGITTVPAHAFFGVMSGYYLSFSKKSKIDNKLSLYKKYLFLSLFTPILLHGFYDFCLLTQDTLLYFIYIGFVIFLYIISIKHIKHLAKIESLFMNNRNNCNSCGNIINKHDNYCETKKNEDE